MPPAPSLAGAFSPPPPGPGQVVHSDDPDEVDLSRWADGGAGGAGAGGGYGGEGEAGRAAEMGGLFRGAGAGGGGGGVRDERFAAMGGFPPSMMGSGNGNGNGNGNGAGGEDPMMRMLQQMMGGGEGGGEGGVPPGLADMFGGAGMGLGGAAPPKAEGERGAGADWWKVMHAVFALALGTYVTSTTRFSGSRVGRAAVGEEGQEEGVRFFWLFATAELLLQSTRFFVERGRGAGRAGGVLGMVMGVLPEPWKGYVALGRRYSGIWTTVVEDAMVVVFVLGLKAWWKGGAVG